uniref:VWFC domain-containing protein n=1 Tax=Anopheles maculatus TaxID=74869 RepID=A0A182SQI2_9DIPT
MLAYMITKFSNGFVECDPASCPAVDDCYFYKKKGPDECCDKCIGCLYEGRHIDSGTEWTDPEDPCMHYKCVSGVVTRSEMKCYAPCSDPSPPRKGQCCPTCLASSSATPRSRNALGAVLDVHVVSCAWESIDEHFSSRWVVKQRGYLITMRGTHDTRTAERIHYNRISSGRGLVKRLLMDSAGNPDGAAHIQRPAVWWW